MFIYYICYISAITGATYEAGKAYRGFNRATEGH